MSPGFCPGRYAVEALQACIQESGDGLAGGKFALFALVVIGFSACVAGAKMFRWDTGQKMSGASKAWVLLALAAWAAVGFAAWHTNRLTPRPGVDILAAPAKWQLITDADINSITYEDIRDYLDDDGDVLPFASNLNDLDDDQRKRLDDIRAKLAAWKPAQDLDIGQRVRYLMNVCAIADVSQDRLEHQFPFVILGRLKQAIPPQELKQALAWVAIDRNDGKVMTQIPELDIDGKFDEPSIRERSGQYAEKFLLHVLNKTITPPK